MFYTVCTKYIHVALAAYVLILWETFLFGHSCNFTVVLSKNVSTWNKTVGLFLFFNSHTQKKKCGYSFTLFCILRGVLTSLQIERLNNALGSFSYLVWFGFMLYIN